MNVKKEEKRSKEKAQWAKFTYVGKETIVITELFENTNVKVSFTTDNTIGKLLAKRHQCTKNKYENCGIYRLTCPTCNMKYAGQTGRSFKVRFHEHFRDFRYGNRKSKFATHLLDNRHSIGPLESVMETLHVTNKGRMMDTLERFYIFRETKLNNQINDKLTVKPNIVFETIVQRDPHTGLPAASIL